MIGASNHNNLGFRYAISALAYAGRLGTSPTTVYSYGSARRYPKAFAVMSNGNGVTTWSQRSIANNSAAGVYQITDTNGNSLSINSLTSSSGWNEGGHVATNLSKTKAFIGSFQDASSSSYVKFITEDNTDLGTKAYKLGSTAVSITNSWRTLVGHDSEYALAIDKAGTNNRDLFGTKMDQSLYYSPYSSPMGTDIRGIYGADQHPDGSSYLLTLSNTGSNLIIRKIVNSVEVATSLVDSNSYTGNPICQTLTVKNDGTIFALYFRTDYTNGHKLFYKVYDTSLNLLDSGIVSSVSSTSFAGLHVTATPDNGVMVVHGTYSGSIITHALDSQNSVYGSDSFASSYMLIGADYNPVTMSVDIAYQVTDSFGDHLIQKVYYTS